ncbi:putative lipoprotein [Fibrobacter succinogenes subsp. succinogenes S85]|nr:putative lipoprotein [Fibrobacter succinogenes subsp. succinogenes S85]
MRFSIQIVYYKQMKFSKLFIIVLFFAFMTACDNGDSLDITSVEENKQFSFEVYLESRIIPDSAIVSMYNSSNRLEKTVKTRKKCFAGAKCMFETAPLKYEEYAKITLFAHATTENKTIQMEFERYAPMNTSTSTINVYYGTPVLNIYTAAASKAIEYNLLEKNMSYGDATQNAYDNMKNFGISDREYEKDQYFPNVSSMNPIQLPYIYCRYFLSDSVFYSDFLELQEAIRDGEWADTLFRIRAADDLARTYQNPNWVDVPGMTFYNQNEYIPNFWESAFGMEVCNDKNIGDTLINANRRSSLYDSVFVCTEQMYSYYAKWQHWVLSRPQRD